MLKNREDKITNTIIPYDFCEITRMEKWINDIADSGMKIFKVVDNEAIKDSIIDSLPEIETRECRRTVRKNIIHIPIFIALLVCVLIGLEFSLRSSCQRIFVETTLIMVAIIDALCIIVSDAFSILIARKHLKNKDYNIIKNGGNRLGINKILYVVSIISSVMLALFFAGNLIEIVT